MYKRKPTGDYLVSVCTNTMCGVLGGDKAFEALRDYLGVGHDETTSDGKITLEHAECLAACDYAPVMTVNYEFFDQITEDSALTLVKQLQNGERPQPTRGTRLCTLKEMAVQLAGFADDRGDDVIADGPAGEPTLAGNRLAERFGIAVPGFDPETPIAKKDEAPAKKPVETLPKAASDAKPAGDGPTPQKDAVKEAKA
jgi:NADH-quinone oxidoreductase subunit E